MLLRQKIILILLGLFLFFLLLEIGLRLGGFIILSLQERRNQLSIRQRGECRILCLGESTTQGQYPGFLEEILNRENIGIKFSVIDKGISGINTGDILLQLEANLDKYQPALVVTMMGINDSRDYMRCEADSISRASLFFKSFKTYKLTRLLWLHIIAKANEAGFYQETESREAGTGEDNYAQLGTKFKKALELNPQKDRVYERLGSLYMEQGKPLEAERAFKKALELNSQNDQAYKRLCSLYVAQGKTVEAEQAFKKALELNPQNDQAYAGLCSLYMAQGKTVEAEQLSRKLLELNPQNDRVYERLGSLYIEEGKPLEAERAFKKALELNPQSDRAYVRLGWFYIDQEKPLEAEQLFKKALELNPQNDQAYAGLCSLYMAQGKTVEAEQLSRKLLELNPQNDRVYERLGSLYIEQGKPLEAEQLFKKALELNPQSDRAYAKLGWFYMAQGRTVEAERLFKKAIELNPRNERLYGRLAVVYGQTGNDILRKKYEKKVKQVSERFYTPLTINNYRRFKQIIDRRKVKWICAQYPMRSIEPLKKIFEGDDGISFVDNEGIFKSAVLRDGYSQYFKNIFAGDFGHCTEKGNRLLAGNIAKAVLKEIYK